MSNAIPISVSPTINVKFSHYRIPHNIRSRLREFHGGGQSDRRTFCSALVQPHEEDSAFGRSGFGSELLGAGMIVVGDADANPPVPGRAGEAQHVGGVIAAS